MIRVFKRYTGRQVALVVAGLLCASAVVGLAIGEGEPDIGTISTVRTATDLKLPLQEFEISAGEWQQLYSASRTLQAACALRFGVVTTEPAVVETLDPSVANSRRYGIVSEQEVTRFGYQAAPELRDSEPPAQWRPTDREFLVVTGATLDGRTLPEAERPRAADGQPLPVGGCAAEVGRSLTNGTAWDPGFIERLSNKSFEQAEADSRVKAVWLDWSQCMQDRGFFFRSPWEPNDMEWGPSRFEEERATASADIECRRSTRLLDVWLAVEAAYQQRALESEFDEITAWRTEVDNRLHRAAEIVANARQR